MIVHVDPMAEQIMTDHAIHAYPSSCSGYLFGSNDPDGKKIFGALAMDATCHTSIVANNFAQTAIQYAQERKWQILGMYFSSPDSPAIPDTLREDAVGQQTDTKVILSICHSRLKDIRSWVMKSCGRYDEETILTFH